LTNSWFSGSFRALTVFEPSTSSLRNSKSTSGAVLGLIDSQVAQRIALRARRFSSVLKIPL
jgi:hypothetical protein